ncbi:MAG: hypothetical protein QXT74_02130 [Candidatus Nezhaarchaeales archaeon]
MRDPSGPPRGAWRAVELSVEPPFDYRLSMQATPPPPPLEASGEELRRCLQIDGEPVPVRLRLSGSVEEPSALLYAPAALGSRLVDEAARRIERLICARLSLEGAYRSAEADPGLRRLVRGLRGLKPWLAPDPWEGLVTSIAFQQVSLRAAYSMLSSLAQRLGASVEAGGAVFRSLPSPREVLAAGQGALRECKLSRAKSSCIANAARMVVEGELDLEGLSSRPTREILGRLMEIRGVGEWTAELTAIISYGRWEVVPASDLGLRKAVARLTGSPTLPPPREVRRLCEPWGPWRGLLAYYVLVAYEMGQLG